MSAVIVWSSRAITARSLAIDKISRVNWWSAKYLLWSILDSLNTQRKPLKIARRISTHRVPFLTYIQQLSLKANNVLYAEVYHTIVKKSDFTNILEEQVVWHWLHTSQRDAHHLSRSWSRSHGMHHLRSLRSEGKQRSLLHGSTQCDSNDASTSTWQSYSILTGFYAIAILIINIIIIIISSWHHRSAIWVWQSG